MVVQFYLENDDHTYIYGGRLFTAEVDDSTGEMLEPYIRKASPVKTIRYYPSKRLFVVYINNIITELIFVMTCWSDDYKAYVIFNNIATSLKECYHGRPNITPIACNIDFSNYIRDNGLAVNI
jgi:hypothetical protein